MNSRKSSECSRRTSTPPPPLPPPSRCSGEIELVDPKTKLSRPRRELAELLARRELPRQIKESDSASEQTKEDDGFGYLLSMPLSSLTTENVENLEDAAAKAESDAATMRALTPTEIWLHELGEFEAAIARIPGMKLLRN